MKLVQLEQIDKSHRNTIDNIPEGWTKCPLKTIAARITKGATPTSYGFKYQEKGIRFVKVENLQNGRIDHDSIKHFISEQANLNQSRSILLAGDVLFSIAGTIGTTCIVREEDLPANTNQALAIIRGTSDVLFPTFLQLQLKSAIGSRQVTNQARGGSMNNISLGDVGNIQVCVSPLVEQKRIVTKVEQLLARVNAARERLAKVPTILKRFRQSVLAAACSGRLTADWREENGFPEIFDRAKLKDVVDSIQIGPFGSLLHKSDYVENGIPVINPTNIANGRIRPSPHVTVTTAKKSDLGRYVLQEHDVVVGRRGEMGRCAVVRKNETGWICGTGSLFVRPGSALLSDFLHILISSPPAIAYLENASVGSTMTNLNQKIFSNMEIAVPRVEEQHEIVRRVRALFTVADRMEARYQKAAVHVEKLTQAVLAKAFRGELVPTEAELARQEGREYEPAWVLLERIKAGREAIEKEKRPKTQAVSRRRHRKAAKGTRPESESAFSADTSESAKIISLDSDLSSQITAVPPVSNKRTPPTEEKASIRAKKHRHETSLRPFPLSDLETDEVMTAFRKACWDRGAMSREDLLKGVSLLLGYRRVGSAIHDRLKGDLRAAIRRKIIGTNGHEVWLETKNMDDYARADLVNFLGSVMRWDTEYDREELIRALANHLGFRRLRDSVRAPIKSAINSAIRQGNIVPSGSTIRRIL